MVGSSWLVGGAAAAEGLSRQPRKRISRLPWSSSWLVLWRGLGIHPIALLFFGAASSRGQSRSDAASYDKQPSRCIGGARVAQLTQRRCLCWAVRHSNNEIVPGGVRGTAAVRACDAAAPQPQAGVLGARRLFLGCPLRAAHSRMEATPAAAAFASSCPAELRAQIRAASTPSLCVTSTRTTVAPRPSPAGEAPEAL